MFVNMDGSARMTPSTEDSLNESNAELQLILNAVVEGVCGLDGEGKATLCNDALAQMAGYEASEIVGQRIKELLYLGRLNDNKYRSLECKPPQKADLHPPAHIVGESLRRKNGTCFPVECWLRPLQRPAGRTTHVLIVRDITEIQRTREVLVHTAKTFRRILASAPDVAWTSDRHGRTIYISPKVQSVLGYTKEEIYNGGEHLRMGCIHPADFGRVHQAYEALFEQQIRFQEEYRLRRKDGVWIWVQDRASSTHEENGVRYADGFLCEITQRKEAEAELRFQTAFLEAQANSTIDGILVVDPRGRSLLQNRRFDDMFKIPANLLSVKEDGKMLGYVVTLIKDAAAFLARVDYLYKHPHETSRDEIELKDGTFLDRYSSPVIDKEGVYYGRIWIFRDITERKRNQDELQQLSLAVEQSPVSVVITDPEGNISYVNRKFTECTGYSREQVEGKNPRILNSGVERPELFRELWSTIKQGRVWHGELCNKKKSGEIFWEAATITPITNPKGIITHFLAVKEDITDRRRSERDLRLTQFSVDHASDAIQWLDTDGHIVYVNQSSCGTLKRTREQLLGLSIPDISPTLPKETWEAIWAQLKTRGSMTFESQFQTAAETILPVEISANYLKFDGQEYCFTFARDISERRVLEGQLRQAQKLEGIGHLAAGIAHEINTPTQFVTDNLTFLRDSWSAAYELLEQYRGAIRAAGETVPADTAAALKASEQKCDLEFIAAEVPRAIDQSLDGAHRVACIVRAMKEFSHPDSAEKTATDLNRAIESTITVARNEWKYVSEIVMEFDETLPPVVCYPGDINQVVLNLIVNAAHAIKEKVKESEKGRITVRTRTDGDSVEISVKDTGAGIPAAIQGKVFDPFFTTKEVGKGTGQGLAFAYTVVVKKHGGKIWFETEVGEGTTFFINLPTKLAGTPKEE